MTKSKAERVEVEILDRSYQLSCPPEEKELLMECVRLVDTRMRQVKTQIKLQGADRIAVMAALTLARDCLTSSAGSSTGNPEDIKAKIAEISATLDQAIAPQERLF